MEIQKHWLRVNSKRLWITHDLQSEKWILCILLNLEKRIEPFRSNRAYSLENFA